MFKIIEQDHKSLQRSIKRIINDSGSYEDKWNAKCDKRENESKNIEKNSR